MKLFKRLKTEERRHEETNSEKDEEMRRAIYSAGKTISNRNPMSRGQGYSGESKAAILQMMRDDD